MTQPYILLVEDDEDLGKLLMQFLMASDFIVEWLKDGTQVIDTVKAQAFDLILLDVMLPHKDGVTLTKEIRSFSELPIIMLTAKSDEVNRLIGLQTGVDDYVCKPFSAPELILRIKAILRRIPQVSHVAAAPEPELILNESQLSVSFEQTQQSLTFIEHQLLALMMGQPQRIYNREQIIAAVYGAYRDISDRTIDSHIKNLRKKLLAVGLEKDCIESVYGVGYRFVAPSQVRLCLQ